MSSNGMSTKENTLQLSPHFLSANSSKSESETKLTASKSEGNITKEVRFY